MHVVKYYKENDHKCLKKVRNIYWVLSIKDSKYIYIAILKYNQILFYIYVIVIYLN